MNFPSDSPADAGAFDDMAYRRARHAERDRTKPQRIIALAVGFGAVVTYGRLALKTEGSDAFAGTQRYVWIVVVCVLVGIFVVVWRVDLDAGLRAQRRLVVTQRRVARRLRTLPRHGWVVLHDRRVGTTGPAIQHLLIGPSGVVVLTSGTTGVVALRALLHPTTDPTAALLEDRIDAPVSAYECTGSLWMPLAGRRIRQELQHTHRGRPDSRAVVEARAQACVAWCPPRLVREDSASRSAR